MLLKRFSSCIFRLTSWSPHNYMPERRHCVVSGCSNSWKSNDVGKKLSFHCWPKQTRLSEKYEQILKTEVSSARNTWVCGVHFQQGRRQFPNELPVWQFPLLQKQIPTKRNLPCRKRFYTKT